MIESSSDKESNLTTEQVSWVNNASTFFGCKVQYSPHQENLYNELMLSSYKFEKKFLLCHRPSPEIIEISQGGNSTLYESLKKIFRLAMLGNIMAIKKIYEIYNKIKSEHELKVFAFINRDFEWKEIRFFEFITKVTDSESNSIYRWLSYFNRNDTFKVLYPIIKNEIKEEPFCAIFCNQIDRVKEWWNKENPEDRKFVATECLKYAFRYRRFEMVAYLVKLGADFNDFLSTYRALHDAVKKGDLELVQVMMGFNPDTALVDNSEKTALDLAKQGFDSASDPSIQNKYQAIINCIDQEMKCEITY